MDKTDFLKKIKACGTLIHDKHINIDSLVGDINKSTNIEKTDKILQFCCRKTCNVQKKPENEKSRKNP